MIVTFEQVAERLPGQFTDTDRPRIEALLRAAERELTSLVGDLTKHDPVLVADTIIDAVLESGAATNPDHLRSENDGAYSYTRFELAGAGGRRARFWWPTNLHELFGIRRSRGRARTVRLGGPIPRGWI